MIWFGNSNAGTCGISPSPLGYAIVARVGAGAAG
jgi:hypothetical protein